jgi:hypothetical protein
LLSIQNLSTLGIKLLHRPERFQRSVSIVAFDGCMIRLSGSSELSQRLLVLGNLNQPVRFAKIHNRLLQHLRFRGSGYACASLDQFQDLLIFTRVRQIQTDGCSQHRQTQELLDFIFGQLLKELV